MAAAHEQITAQGSAVSMEQIAAASGVAVGTLYKHFPNKAELVNAVVAASFAEVATDAEDSLRRADQGSPAMSELEGFLTRLTDTIANNHAVKAAASSLNTDHATHPAMKDVETRVTAALDRLVRTAHEQGQLRADCTVEDLYLMLSTAPADQPPAARARWLALLLTGLTAR